MISHGQWNVRGSDLLFAGRIIKELVYDSLWSHGGHGDGGNMIRWWSLCWPRSVRGYNKQSPSTNPFIKRELVLLPEAKMMSVLIMQHHLTYPE